MRYVPLMYSLVLVHPKHKKPRVLLLLFHQNEISSLLDNGGSVLQVLQTTAELLNHWGVVWLDSFPERLIERAGLQQIFSCLTASTARALLCMASA